MRRGRGGGALRSTVRFRSEEVGVPALYPAREKSRAFFVFFPQNVEKSQKKDEFARFIIYAQNYNMTQGGLHHETDPELETMYCNRIDPGFVLSGRVCAGGYPGASSRRYQEI